MKELPKKYDHKETESRWQKQWLDSGTYEWDSSLPRAENYVIDTPPPTVSGLLHMGHIFSYTQADFVARWQRMSGKNVFYPMGFDDNGLPTERLVEKVKKKRAVDYPSREAFIEACEGVAEEARRDFRALFQSIALSVDWNHEYHTISERSRKLGQLSFLDLYRKGKVERRLAPMLWDPVDQTAIAQAEVEDKEHPSNFCDIVFRVEGAEGTHSPLAGESNPAQTDLVGGQPLGDEATIPPTESHASTALQQGSSAPPQGGSDHVVIATTRPELIPACVGIFYHPEDERYQHLKGKYAITPLFGVKVPILEDDSVEMEKGTGIMMCCTFGDEADIEKWRKHKLHTRTVLNKYGKFEFHAFYEENSGATSICPISSKDIGDLKITDLTGADFENSPMQTGTANFNADNCLDIDNCIKNLIEINGLRASHHDTGFNKDPSKSARAKMIQLLEESGELIEVKPITHAVKCAERSGAPLEILTTQQWFVDIMSQKDELLAHSRSCNWHPEWMAKRMEQWIEGLSMDWCISRQRYYGVPFPIWYLAPIAAENEYLGKTDFGSAIGTTFTQEILEVTASPEWLPINPLDTDQTKKFFESKGYKVIGLDAIKTNFRNNESDAFDLIVEKEGKKYAVLAETDVFDTWFTSSISPQLSSGGIGPASSLPGSSGQSMDHPDKPGDDGFILDPDMHSKLYPADLRPQAHEIIRTWAFYTLVKSHYHGDCTPWKNLMISGWCLAEDKQKMSKSKGNVVTPIGLIEDNGADVVRYWASTSKLGQDTAYSQDLLKIGKKLVTKLWNATKFAAIHLNKLPPEFSAENSTGQSSGLARPTDRASCSIDTSSITSTLDKWILTRLHRTVKKATESFEAYEYAAALRAIEDFFWNDFCDNYLELVKKRAYGEHTGEGTESADSTSAPALSSRSDSPHESQETFAGQSKQGQMSAVHTIYSCLDGILRLFAPILPHITEELWSHIFDMKHAMVGSIHAKGNWPKADDYLYDETAEAQGIAVVELLEQVRKEKSEAGVSIKVPATTCVISKALDKSAEEDFKAAGNILDITLSPNAEKQEEYRLDSLTLAKESDAA